MCVHSSIGHADPQNWFDPGVGRYCIPVHYILLKYLLGTVTIYSDILFLHFLFKNSKLSIEKKKRKDHYFPIFWVGWQRANKHLFF